LREEDATSGTISLTTVTSSQVTGSFDLTLYAGPGEDHLTGDFAAAVCNLTLPQPSAVPAVYWLRTAACPK
jgi:hypothetical protein